MANSTPVLKFSENIVHSVSDDCRVLTIPPQKGSYVPIDHSAKLYEAWRGIGASEFRSFKGEGYIVTFGEQISQETLDMAIIVYMAMSLPLEQEEGAL
jgi:hypothetical protein